MRTFTTLLTLAIIAITTTAAADGPNATGDFVGVATQVPTDLTVPPDGEKARSFQVDIITADRHGDDQFIKAQGIIDSAIATNPTGNCGTWMATEGFPGGGFWINTEGETFFELTVSGEVYWRTRGGDMVLSKFRPQDELCLEFQLGAGGIVVPRQEEFATMDIVDDGRGIYEFATGTIEVSLFDKIRILDPASGIGLPAVVDVSGTYAMCSPELPGYPECLPLD